MSEITRILSAIEPGDPHDIKFPVKIFEDQDLVSPDGGLTCWPVPGGSSLFPGKS